MEKNFIEIWGDLVDLKDLLLTIFVCSVTTMGGFFLAPAETSKQLFFGLAGAVLGFILNLFLTKPKRQVEEEN